jgi:hypothetical protein
MQGVYFTMRELAAVIVIEFLTRGWSIGVFEEVVALARIFAGDTWGYFSIIAM